VFVGVWENSSCGEREFLRRIELKGDGTFSAVDEVAPCPPEAKCVWSGVINWRGTWEKAGERIALSLEPVPGEKPLEFQPEGFVILAEDPVSIGEQTGELVCPFRRVED
jgi:hypothetical protein